MYSSVIFRSLLVLFIFCLFLGLVTSTSKLNHKLRPDATITYHNYSICRGPKVVNLTKYTTILERREHDYVAVTNMTVLEAVVVDEIRMMVYAKKQKVKTLLYNYKLQNPCKNFGFAILLKNFNPTNCAVKQGIYYARTSIADYLEKSVGLASEFLTEEHSFKFMILSKKGNLFCVTGDVTYG